MKINKAFTLAETLIVLIIIAIIAMLLITSLSDMGADKEKVMFKKAYQNAERIVGELVNDEVYYPYVPGNVGFYNTSEVSVDESPDSPRYGGEQKFCRLFASKLNTQTDVTYATSGGQGSCFFQTTDSISWIVGSNFTKSSKPAVTIEVDVNGNKDITGHIGKGPNSKNPADKNRDTFEMIVYYDGRMTVQGEQEKEFLGSHDVREKKETSTSSTSSTSTTPTTTTKTGAPTRVIISQY